MANNDDQFVIRYESKDHEVFFFDRPTKDGILWTDDDTAQILVFGSGVEADKMVQLCLERGLFPKGFDISRLAIAFRSHPADGGAAARAYKDIIEGREPEDHHVEWHP